MLKFSRNALVLSILSSFRVLVVSWLCLVCFLLAKIGDEGAVVHDKKQALAPAFL